jgi:ergothioneine biosynthesis protein EgtB
MNIDNAAISITDTAGVAASDEPNRAKSRFSEVRKFTEKIVEPLRTEDYIVQAMDDVSPANWHLGHTTWFYETFILVPYQSDYRVFHPGFDHLFNSYYVTHGEPFERANRGWLSRPDVNEIREYRNYVERHMLKLLDNIDAERLAVISPILEVGMHHEQQHQELLLTDIKYNLSVNPLTPVYQAAVTKESAETAPILQWLNYEEGLTKIGHDGQDFSYDNEQPRHKVWLDAFQLASRPVTNGEYIEFIDDGGYRNPKYWLSEGWSIVDGNKWGSPLYWQQVGGEWHTFTLSGMKKINRAEPVCHVSYYEADAYARWAGKRLPREAEWEKAMTSSSVTEGNFAETGRFHPSAYYQNDQLGLSKGFGDVWEWTMSSYTPYPGNKPYDGVLGEYNAKFMSSQMVLRGGSCATPESHIRATYRNFFHPDKRWQFSGIRLAGDKS